MKLALALLTVSAFAFLAPVCAHAEIIYVSDGASPKCGGTITAGYSGDFEAFTFSFGGTSTQPTTPGTKPTPTLGALVISKQLDACSAPLITEFLSGQIIPTLKLIEVKTGADGVPIPILTITLEGAQIIDYRITGNDSGPSGEQVSFQFEGAAIHSTPVDAAGKPGTPSTLIYDSSKNAVQ